MGLFSFVKDAGAKIFGSKEEEAQVVERAKADHLLKRIKQFNLRSDSVEATLQGDVLTLTGTVDTEKEKNRIIMAMGNYRGIAKVDDRIVVEEACCDVPLEKQFYTVKSGDSLSKISKAVYGDANKYNVIFEANKPMLSDPNLIYPGQNLVIPVLD
ncbi:MAG: peptidoglycan-binding protein LysM [Chitinophagales bacterium]